MTTPATLADAIKIADIYRRSIKSQPGQYAPWESAGFFAIHYVMDDLIDCLKKGRQPINPAAAGGAVLQLLFSLRESRSAMEKIGEIHMVSDHVNGLLKMADQIESAIDSWKINEPLSRAQYVSGKYLTRTVPVIPLNDGIL